MRGSEFKAWRERVGLTQQQVAERLGVTRTTIQNWESAVTPIPQAVDMSRATWEARLRQENPNLGPVTLVYSDGPMFVSPYGPRRRPAMMHQEPYPTNAAAIARVQQLWGRDNFHNAFVLEASGVPVWNVVELGRVVSGEDKDAPTLPNLLRAIAAQVRSNSRNFVRGLKRLTPAEAKKQQQAIEAEADALERLARSGLPAILHDQLQVEGIFSNLLRLGTKAPDGLVRNVAQALVVFEQEPVGAEPRLEQSGYVVDYKGCEIAYPPVPMFANRWTVNVSSNDPRTLNRLGGRAVVIDDHTSLQAAIAKAKRYVDGLS